MVVAARWPERLSVHFLLLLLHTIMLLRQLQPKNTRFKIQLASPEERNRSRRGIFLMICSSIDPLSPSPDWLPYFFISTLVETETLCLVVLSHTL